MPENISEISFSNVKFSISLSTVHLHFAFIAVFKSHCALEFMLGSIFLLSFINGSIGENVEDFVHFECNFFGAIFSVLVLCFLNEVLLGVLILCPDILMIVWKIS